VAKILAILTQNPAYRKKINLTLGYQEKRRFFLRKSPKIVILIITPETHKTRIDESAIWLQVSVSFILKPMLKIYFWDHFMNTFAEKMD
jgi:hypothetical protein